MKAKTLVVSALCLVVACAFSGCQTTPTQDGAMAGALLGSAAGAIIGHQSDHQGEGALIGAGAGAIAGALIGDAVDESRRNARPQTYARPAAPASQPTFPASEPTPATSPAQQGRYETRIMTGPSGEKYEERVWVACD